MADFDPYHKWLGIGDPVRPPNHYRLLGIEIYENDRDVIEAAARRQANFLESLGDHPRAAVAKRINDEIAQAKACLLDSNDKRIYDVELACMLESVDGLAGNTRDRDPPLPTQRLNLSPLKRHQKILMPASNPPTVGMQSSDTAAAKEIPRQFVLQDLGQQSDSGSLRWLLASGLMIFAVLVAIVFFIWPSGRSQDTNQVVPPNRQIENVRVDDE